MTATRKGGDLTLAVFTYGDNQQVRTLAIDGQTWFVAKDVCGVLGIQNSRHALAKILDKDEVTVSQIATPSRGRVVMQMVSESGLHTLIMRSRKPNAKAFRKWVTGEVLPSVLRTGSYTKPAEALPQPSAPALPMVEMGNVIDATHVPYERVTWRNGTVIVLQMNGRTWYCMTHVLRAMGILYHQGSESARSLPAAHTCRMRIYGQAATIWFIDDVALRMFLASKGEVTSQLTLNIA